MFAPSPLIIVREIKQEIKQGHRLLLNPHKNLASAFDKNLLEPNNQFMTGMVLKQAVIPNII